MLKFLHIENIAVIEKADIEFGNGLIILTGETGAGKSIIIDAINAILGYRTSRDLVRTGTDRALVTAVFSDVGPTAEKYFNDNGIFADENSEYIVNKVINSDGKSSIRINGQPVNLAVMRDIGVYLINIHGQHDNQSLLNPDSHLKFIDAVADNKKIIDDYYSEFKYLNSVRKKLEEADTDAETRARRREMLNFSITELENAVLCDGELETLKTKINLFRNSEKIIKNLNSARKILLGDDENDGAFAAVTDAAEFIAKSDIAELNDISDKLSVFSIELEEMGLSVSRFLDTISFDESEMAEISDRVELIKRVISKYGGSEASAIEYLNNAKAEIEKIDNNDELIANLSTELDKSRERLVNKASVLTESRKRAADLFCENVSQVLFELDMPDVKFGYTCNNGRYTKVGCDEFEFLISANRGENMRPLSKIASGGELSRVMLAIKSVLTVNDPVSTLIFDEIDTGISGRAAMKIASKLKRLAKIKQVLCVTHLAQIAAAADNHLLIEKNASDDRTKTSVTALDNDGRLNELSRIIGGRVTDANRQSAAELLKFDY